MVKAEAGSCAKNHNATQSWLEGTYLVAQGHIGTKETENKRFNRRRPNPGFQETGGKVKTLSAQGSMGLGP